MSTSEKRCPECNAIIKDNEAFCMNCGAVISEENVANENRADMPNADSANDKVVKETRTEMPNAMSSGMPADEGDTISRSNIMGSVNKTNNTTLNDASTTTTTTNNTQNVNTNVINHSTSNLNNTSNINNTTNTNKTIINQQAAPEFCAVCGMSLNSDNKARCPKCQKTICADCLVKGKNRCTECEKKAIDEYRLAFQELLYTTDGKIGVAGERLMKRKAEELNVVESAKKIDDDLISLFQCSAKEEQKTQPQQQPAPSEESKGVGSISGRKPLTMSKEETKTSGGSSKLALVAIIAIAIAVAGYFYLAGGDKKVDAVAETNNEQVEVKKNVEVKKVVEVKQDDEPKTPVAPQKKEPAKVKKATPVAKDTNYEEGMKAYEAQNGVEAIKKFKASGSAKSQYMIGLIYENGCGSIAKNAMKARQAFKEAAKLGSEEAKAKL